MQYKSFEKLYGFKYKTDNLYWIFLFLLINHLFAHSYLVLSDLW